MKVLSLVFLTLFGLALSDKPDSSNGPQVTGTVEKVPIDTKVQHKSGSFSAPASGSSSSLGYSAPTAQASSYSAQAPSFSAPSPTYSASSAAAAPSSPAASYDTQSAYSGAGATAAGGEVGSQGYYYYYYPVVNNKESQGGSSFHEHEAAESSGTGLAALLAGKGVLVALGIGAIIILAVAGTTINFNNGRSLKDLTDAATEKLDVITGLVVDAIDLYDSVN
ncbi:uncharacterized protein [Lepeophtheirus salmonis]|uniref:uncharacterized protein n=1 Tax=Lepeophtheirus salmonis TaxID=72036 RepID=UPI001AE58BAE|nr:uncharacterized protein LOC121128304 [Lepeophtheirus salmonis]